MCMLGACTYLHVSVLLGWLSAQSEDRAPGLHQCMGLQGVEVVSPQDQKLQNEQSSYTSCPDAPTNRH